MRLPSKTKSMTTVMSLTFGIVVATTTTSAFSKGSILDDAIHDYEGGTYSSFQYEPSSSNVKPYQITILDEALSDYTDEHVVAGNSQNENLERAEFAALDESSSVPWVLQVVD